MGFKWLCPACGHVNEYKGKKTTNVVVRCLVCKEDIKASSHIYGRDSLPQLPKTTNELPKTTKYETRARNPPSSISVEIDYNAVLKCMERGISTIENKPQIKAKKGAYYWDYIAWTKEFEKLKLLEMGDEK